MDFAGIGWGTAPGIKEPASDLQRRIGHFSNLPQLLAEARELGTDVVYVWDYWERAGDDAEHYRNKGDYCPRRDMGGEPALRAGIQMVHRQGGKVILYVEPFIVWRQSEVGRRKGALWTDLLNLPFYGPDNPTMIAPFRPWQDHIVDLCTRLVKQYGADGTDLDSWGWQWNWSMRNLEEGRTYTPQEFTRGVLELADRVRGAIGPNRVVALRVDKRPAGPIRARRPQLRLRHARWPALAQPIPHPRVPGALRHAARQLH